MALRRNTCTAGCSYGVFTSGNSAFRINAFDTTQMSVHRPGPSQSHQMSTHSNVTIQNSVCLCTLRRPHPDHPRSSIPSIPLCNAPPEASCPPASRDNPHHAYPRKNDLVSCFLIFSDLGCYFLHNSLRFLRAKRTVYKVILHINYVNVFCDNSSL